MHARSARFRLARTAATLCLCTAALAGQSPPALPAAPTDRLDARIRALEQEARQLAGTSRTLLSELRALEVDRDLRRAEALQADAAVADAQRALDASTRRLEALEQQRVAELPTLRRQLVDLYKRGRLGYARLLFAAENLRELGRASRAIGAMVTLNQQRIERHRRTVEAVRQERASLEEQTRTLEARQATLQEARVRAERAVAAHASRIAEIDSRRDLAARYAGELSVARETLLASLAGRPSPAAGAAAPAVPLAPFRGALDWPVEGRVVGGFHDTANRLGGSAVRNGIEIAADEGRPVRAVHGGTVVHADAFPGFGMLVIVDHGGDDYSLYGYLGGIGVAVGTAVSAGDELGQVGASPAGPAALYFEMRIDGRSVDPVQWLKPR